MKSLVAITLLAFSMAGSANIIWDFTLFGSTGYFETEGDLDANGTGGGKILNLTFTDSTREDMPLTGWVGGGSLAFGDDYLSASVNYSVDIMLDTTFNGLPAILPFTQSFSGSNLSRPPNLELEIGGIGNYSGCADDIGRTVSMGHSIYSDYCASNGYVATNRIFFSDPRDSLLTAVTTPSTASVPEPGALALLGLGALLMTRRRSQKAL